MIEEVSKPSKGNEELPPKQIANMWIDNSTAEENKAEGVSAEIDEEFKKEHQNYISLKIRRR